MQLKYMHQLETQGTYCSLILELYLYFNLLVNHLLGEVNYLAIIAELLLLHTLSMYPPSK